MFIPSLKVERKYLLEKSIHRQPIDINSPVRPPCTLPLVTSMQSRRDIDVLPLCLEARLMEIYLSNLFSTLVFSLCLPSSQSSHTFV